MWKEKRRNDLFFTEGYFESVRNFIHKHGTRMLVKERDSYNKIIFEINSVLGNRIDGRGNEYGK